MRSICLLRRIEGYLKQNDIPQAAYTLHVHDGQPKLRALVQRSTSDARHGQFGFLNDKIHFAIPDRRRQNEIITDIQVVSVVSFVIAAEIRTTSARTQKIM